MFTARYVVHTMYLCVLCGSENKQRLFQYTAINWMVFIADRKFVYCAVPTGSLNIIQGPVHVTCGGQGDTGTGFSLSTSVFPYQYHSTNAPHSCPYQNGKQVKSRNLKKSNAVSDIGEALDRNVATFTLFLLLKVSNFVKCAHGITHKKSANYSICESFLRPLYKTECPYI